MSTGLEYTFAAIDAVNAQSDDGPAIIKAADTVLFGPKSTVDSLLFVNLIVAVEEAIMDETGKTVTLITEETMTLDETPFDTVEKLGTYIDALLSA